ncbi:hypothetical protein EDB86DRAFT_3135210 [Lactarius hatsudake]|nr:hypothetical protein EDB86DRAFT_3135210 [Lactarius hatsudake]
MTPDSFPQAFRRIRCNLHGSSKRVGICALGETPRLGLNSLGFIERVLLFRQEYITAFNFLGLGLSTRRENSVVVTGHPGIVKTSFLYYVLLRRLSSKSPTAFQLPDGCILFDEGGPQEFSRFPKHTVALADSTTTGMEPPCVAFQDAAKAYVRVIQTTSPALDNSKGWYKEVSANQYVMDYSSSEEMDVFGKILDLNCDVLQRIYNTWGPSTHNCVYLTRHPGQEGVYAGDVESAVRDFVKKFQHSPTYINPFAESHKIISVRPKEVGPRDEGRSRLTARVATRRIERMILLYSIKAEVAEQISFYKMLSTHKWFGSSPTGYTLRTYVLACLSAHPASKPLPCIAADSGPSTLEIPVSLRERSFSLDSAASLKDVNNHTVPFCLIPTSSNFVAFDAIVCGQDYFFTIQVAVSSRHSANPCCFENIRCEVPPLFLESRKWYHVFVTNDKKEEGRKIVKPEAEESPGRGHHLLGGYRD